MRNKLLPEEKMNQAVVNRIRSKVFQKQALTSAEEQMVEALWNSMIKYYKKDIDRTWDIITWDIVNNKGFSAVNYFIVYSRLTKLQEFYWIAEEVSDIHKKMFIGKFPEDVVSPTLFRSKNINIYVDTKAQCVFLEPLKEGVRVGPVYAKGYKIEDLMIFLTIADQMITQIEAS